MQPSVELIEFLTRNSIPWLRYDEAKDKLIMVVDNHLLSTYRACPQHFVFAHVEGWRRKSITGKTERNWFLDFGIALHTMLELYYKNFRSPDFSPVDFCTKRATEVWYEMQMDIHAEHKEYKLIGGLHGFVGLLIQYTTVLSSQNEKLRVLGTEVSFGRNLEVPLFIGDTYELYLAGRMDLIVDDGYFICPMDHKTMGTFRGDPGLRYENDEGPTGYIFALKTVLPQFIPEDQILKRDCSKILMNLISKTPVTNPIERFKRIQIRKTTEQLVQYQHRMINTAEKLLIDMNTVATSFETSRNTQVCQNWMHLQCPYFDVCRQQSSAAVEATLSNGFVKLPVWNTEEIVPAS